VGGEPPADRLQPRLAVVVVERLAGGHLRDVRGRVEVVGVRERDAQPLGDRGPDRRLAGTGHAHHDEQRSLGHLSSSGVVAGWSLVVWSPSHGDSMIISLQPIDLNHLLFARFVR